MAASCAYILTLGKRHFRYAPSAYRVCVSPTQARKLFGSTEKPKPLACGVFACAFAHPKADRIVKITRDPSDVAGLIQGQGLPQVPKIYEAHRLAGQPWWATPRRRTQRWQEWPERPEAFALIVERLRPLTGVEKATWNKRIKRMLRFQENVALRQKATSRSVTLPFAHTRYAKPPTIGDMAKSVCPSRPAAEAENCQLRVRELNKMSAALRARGIEWMDIHAGNIGVDKKGRWKALDLGASTTPLQTELPELAGARRRRR